MAKVLITGASGLIGKRLTELLIAKGYAINHLGRGTSNNHPQTSPVGHYIWNVESGDIDKRAFEGVSAIIHLAGAGIAEKRWTNKRKKEILDSRIQSARLIKDFLKKGKHTVSTFISSSAVGYYGDGGNEILKEEHAAGKGFLAQVCQQWEKPAIEIGQSGIREVRCRTGIVLSKAGGALPELTKTMPLGIAPYFAKQPLYYPWIHIDDICGIYLHALETTSINGAYNAVAPTPLPMKDLMKAIIVARKSKALLLPVPPVVIQFILGEMSTTVLQSQRCSAEKIIAAGYQFKFGNIQQALHNIYA